MSSRKNAAHVFETRYAVFEPSFPRATAANTAPGKTTESGVQVVDRRAASAFARAQLEAFPPIPPPPRLPSITLAATPVAVLPIAMIRRTPKPAVAAASKPKTQPRAEATTEVVAPAGTLRNVALALAGGIAGAALATGLLFLFA